MAGAEALTGWLSAQELKPSLVWLGEPTEMQVVNGHKGVTSCCTKFQGVAGHASHPQKNGVSATAMAIKFGNWLLQRQELHALRPYQNSAFDPPYTTFNIGLLEGGSASNVLAKQAQVTWEYRLHPGDDDTTLKQALNAFFAKEKESIPETYKTQTSIETETHISIPPFITRTGNAAEEMLLDLLQQKSAKVVPFATEAGYFQKIGMQVVICGPGSIAQAHQANEFVSLAQLDMCRTVLQDYIKTIAV